MEVLFFVETLLLQTTFLDNNFEDRSLVPSRMSSRQPEYQREFEWNPAMWNGLPTGMSMVLSKRIITPL